MSDLDRACLEYLDSRYFVKCNLLDRSYYKLCKSMPWKCIYAKNMPPNYVKGVKILHSTNYEVVQKFILQIEELYTHYDFSYKDKFMKASNLKFISNYKYEFPPDTAGLLYCTDTLYVMNGKNMIQAFVNHPYVYHKWSHWHLLDHRGYIYTQDKIGELFK